VGSGGIRGSREKLLFGRGVAESRSREVGESGSRGGRELESTDKTDGTRRKFGGSWGWVGGELGRVVGVVLRWFGGWLVKGIGRVRCVLSDT